MTSFLITYNLKAPHLNQAPLIDAIKSYDGYWHGINSTWIVYADSTSAAIRDHLIQYIGNNDEILVLKLSGEGAWRGINPELSQWLLRFL